MLNGAAGSVHEIQMPGQRLREVGENAVHLHRQVEVEGVVHVLLEVLGQIAVFVA